MSFKRTKELKVKHGTYQNKEGETKNNYRTIGSLMENDDGGKFILLDPTVNLAAFKRDEGRDSVMVSLFDPKVKEQSETTGTEEV